MENKNRSEKFKIAIYWVSTMLLCFGMTAGGVSQLLQTKVNADGMAHLGYPLYFMSILGTWKILGVVTILLPGFTLLKEWAYSGFFFAMSGAVVSHIICGDVFVEWIAPFIFMLLAIVSWKLRPQNRKLPALTASPTSLP